VGVDVFLLSWSLFFFVAAHPIRGKDFESIDALTAALELLHPGALVVGGDGMTGIRGKSTDGNPDDLTSEEKKERNLVKHSEEEFKQQQLKKHGVNGHGSKNAKQMEDKVHGGKDKHGHKKTTNGKPLSMHERAQAAMAVSCGVACVGAPKVLSWL
jgi:hypothetical protein